MGFAVFIIIMLLVALTLFLNSTNCNVCIVVYFGHFFCLGFCVFFALFLSLS